MGSVQRAGPFGVLQALGVADVQISGVCRVPCFRVPLRVPLKGSFEGSIGFRGLGDVVSRRGYPNYNLLISLLSPMSL